MVLIFHILLEAGADFSNCIASVPGTHCNCYFMYERQLCVCVPGASLQEVKVQRRNGALCSGHQCK